MECPEKESFAGRASIPDVDQSDVVAVIRLVVLGVDAQPLGGWVTLERTIEFRIIYLQGKQLGLLPESHHQRRSAAHPLERATSMDA